MRHFSQPGAWTLVTLLLCASAPANAENLVLQEVRYWTLNGITRIAIQLSGPTEVKRDRLPNPERHFFDFQRTVPSKKGMQTIAVGDSLVRQIRIAEAKPGVARVVLDLVEKAELSTSELANPHRFIIEVKKPGYIPPETPLPSLASTPVPTPPPAMVTKPGKSVRAFTPPPTRSLPATQFLPLAPVITAQAKTRRPALPQAPKVTFPTSYRAAAASVPVKRPVETTRVETTLAKATTPPPASPSPAPVTPALPAQTLRRGPGAGNSMTRALGLKIRRVVLDPGHGGHDQGSSGPTGLLEKDIVLDVALRLGELISTNLGSEIVYTRNDDHFVPLETRTRIANDSRADLFVSIHANSSVIRTVSGVETYYLSFTTSKEALDVAARENATSERSVFELRDLLQKIALQEKIDESRDFAARVNASLFRVWGQSPATRNRGVKKAPFVVLIGASMPSILTEIGFISNPRDERELRKPETRQKIAEALFKGIEQYAESLSHFTVARRAADNE